MCGRYNIVPSVDFWFNFFDLMRVVDFEDLLKPRYNVAPSTQVPILVERDGALVVEMMRWGFIPVWNKDERPRMINNARSETVATSGMFKRAFRSRRCIFVASGFYEWRQADKVPFNIRNRDQAPLLMAGIWEAWQDRPTAAIITTEPNQTMVSIHDRMPVMVPQDCVRDWLTTELPEHYLRPAPDDQLEAYQVGPRVGSVRNDDPSLIDAV